MSSSDDCYSSDYDLVWDEYSGTWCDDNGVLSNEGVEDFDENEYNKDYDEGYNDAVILY